MHLFLSSRLIETVSMVTNYLQVGCLFVNSMCDVNVVEYLPCIHEQLVDMVHISSAGGRSVCEDGVCVRKRDQGNARTLGKEGRR